MSFLKNIFSKKDSAIKSYKDFWDWFQNSERTFSYVVKQHQNIEKDFFDRVSPKLNELKDGFFLLTGMFDKDTVELIITADGVIKNIAFVEELISAAPTINGWKFTALKPAMDIKNVSIGMAGYKFSADNLYFVSNELAAYPDEIDITIVHEDYNQENKDVIARGSLIFLDNYLGELEFVTNIDNLKFVGKRDVNQELVPIAKLKDFLIWRQKEFVEKYEGVRHNTEGDNYSMLEAQLENGNPLIAVINTDILDWENKASHPWILEVEIAYNGESRNGMPDEIAYPLLNEIEDEITGELKDFEGYLNIGRQTANGSREIYFACKEFRKPSKVLYHIQNVYADRIKVSYNIYKDKYWQSFNRFINNYSN